MNPWRGLDELPKSVWLLSIASMVNRFGMMALPYIMLYLKNDIGVTESEASNAILVYGFGSLIATPLIGKLSDKVGTPLIMKLSLIVPGFYLFLFPLFKDYYYILGLCFLWSILAEGFRPAAMSMISKVIEPGQNKPAFALYRVAINLGMSIGLYLGGELSEINFNYLFYFDGITSILSGILLILFKIDDKKIIKPGDEEKKSITPPAELLGTNSKAFYRYVYFLVAIIPVTMVFFQHLSTLSLYVANFLDYGNAVFGRLTAFNLLLIVLVEVPLNNWMRDWDNRKALLLGGVLTAIGFGLTAFSYTLVPLALTIIVWTFGEMIFFPVVSSFAVELSPENKRGMYMGYFQIPFAISFMFGPKLGAYVYQYQGPQALWVWCFVFGVISTLMMLGLKTSNKGKAKLNET